MNANELLNKLKWNIYMRLPNGGIYTKCKKRIQNPSNNSLEYIFNGQYLENSILDMFIKGYYSKDKKDIYNFYKHLLKSDKVKLINIDNNLFMEFNLKEKLIKIPFPNFNDLNELAIYRFELLDLIIPYLLSDIKDFNKLSFNEGPYEYYGKKVEIKLKENDCVLDCGANFGIFSSFAASKGCEVYSFEPLKDAVERYLQKLNVIYPNIKIINEALSNKIGTQFINIDTENYGGSYIIEHSHNKENAISTTTIDEFINAKNINRVDFIKADIEGSECAMLEGAQYTLKYFHPNLSICTYHNLNDKQKIKKLILSANPNYELESNWKKIYAQHK